MQILKDDIRNKIASSALAEFKREGYLQTSMRQIAQLAGVTSGNIYRYYTNKEQLFDAIVQPVYEQYTIYMTEIRQKIEYSYTRDALDTPGYFNNIETTIVKLFKTFSTELMILLNRSEGSKYASAKSDLTLMTFSILESVFMKAKGNKDTLNEQDTALARMLSSSIVEGICLILRDNEEGDALARLVDQFLFVYTEGITAVIKQLK